MAFTKPVTTVLLEATIVGLGVTALGMLALQATAHGNKPTQTKAIAGAMFLSGAAFHIISEYAGFNAMYANSYVAAQRKTLNLPPC